MSGVWPKAARWPSKRSMAESSRIGKPKIALQVYFKKYNNLDVLFAECKEVLSFMEPHKPTKSMSMHLLLYKAQMHDWFSNQELDQAVQSLTGDKIQEVFQLLRDGQQKHYGDQACLEFFESIFLDGLRVLCESYAEDSLVKDVGPHIAKKFQDVLSFAKRFSHGKQDVWLA
jgi:hypothetical protein